MVLSVSPTEPHPTGQARSWLSPAVVLKAMAYNDTSQIITLYTPDYGRIGAVVKGARSPKSKMAGVCLPLNYGQVQLFRGKTLHTLSQYQPLASFPNLRQNFEALSFGLFAAQLIDTLTTEHDHESATIFETLVTCLRSLDDCRLPAVVVSVVFQAQLLQATGYWPNLTHCVATEALMVSDANPMETPTVEWVAFAPAWGGVVSAAAARSIPPAPTGQPGWVKVSVPTLQCLSQAQSLVINDMDVRLIDESVWQKTLKFLAYYIPTQVEGTQRAFKGLGQMGLLAAV
jgi:DNA repair protein RecO (recombination protein O)